MPKHFVVAEVDKSRNPVGAWLVIAAPDDFDPAGETPFSEESVAHPVASFSDRDQAFIKRDRLNLTQ